jgi:hypothetical protein
MVAGEIQHSNDMTLREIIELDSVLESHVRAMRDTLYGRPTTQRNWESCCDFWMRDWQWLIDAMVRAGFKMDTPFTLQPFSPPPEKH